MNDMQRYWNVFEGKLSEREPFRMMSPRHDRLAAMAVELYGADHAGGEHEPFAESPRETA